MEITQIIMVGGMDGTRDVTIQTEELRARGKFFDTGGEKVW